MTSLVEQTVRVLSGSRPFVQEKSLSNAEIEDLIDKGKEVTAAKDVLSWIRDVRKTWNKNYSLHPNVVMKLMKITAIRQGRWGWSVPGGKVPKDFEG